MSRNGFAAIAAIFIVLVLAGLGVMMTTIFTAQQRSSTFDLLGIRALQAARAGIEFGVYQALRNSACAATSTFALGGALTGFSVNVQCATDAGPATHDEAGTAIAVYRITATACNRGACPGVADATYVERELRATVGTNPP